MKIGMITYGLNRPLTGIGRYEVELIKALLKSEQVSLTLLTAGSPAALPGADKVAQIPMPGCQLMPGLITFGNLWCRWIAERFDLIHDPIGLSPFYLVKASNKTVTTVHDTFPLTCPGNSSQAEVLTYRWWLPLSLKKVGHIIMDSESSAQELKDHFRLGSTMVSVIYPGVDALFQRALSEEVYACKKRYELPNEYILFVGSVTKRKNLHGLIKAIAKLHAEKKRCDLVVVGPGDYISVRRLVLAAGLQENVHFIKYVPKHELPCLYSGARVFAFPSFCEGFGFPPLEAMACGTPVVCSDRGSLPEVVGESALVISPGDISGMANALDRLMTDDTLRQKLITRGLARVKKFNWQQTANAVVTLYQELIYA